jgi:hypothetical protein
MINLLWKVHQDSWQFFNQCEKWESGERPPRSNLRNTVNALIDDIGLSTTITCPVSDFLGTSGAAPKREPRDPKREAGVRGGHGKQATKNSSIPPLCATVVREFNRLHPTLDISTFVRKTGIKYRCQGGHKRGLHQLRATQQVLRNVPLPSPSRHGPR